MSDDGYLRVSGLRKSFGGAEILGGVDLAANRGELLALLGPSGCGKTTVLRILAGLLAPDSGDATLAGRSLAEVPAHRRDIGVVFQNYALFPHLSVRGNIRFGLEMRGVRRAEADSRVDEALDLVQLSGLGARRPAELSGGQQQRVALARALVIRPRLLLLDEPLSNLDATLRAAMRVDLRALHLRAGLTTILVTHDQAEAMTMADRVAVMHRGKIDQIGAPEQIYHDPGSLFVASFVGSPAAASLRVAAAEGGFRVGGRHWRPQPALARAFARALASRGEVTASVRPERVRLADPGDPQALPGTVAAVEFLGADRLVHVDVGDQRVVLRTGNDAASPSGAVGLLMPEELPLFEPESGRRIYPSG